MLKYLYVKEIFKEIPGEITLGISISGCRIRCPYCHSKELWSDKGKYLNIKALKALMKQHQGVTCICFFGGEHDIDSLMGLLKYLYGSVETAWYSGLDKLPEGKSEILNYLNYYKEGHYDEHLGGLDCETTNQRLYHVIHYGYYVNLEDITYKLQKRTTNENQSI